jgi:hypothetical protein
MPEQTNIFPIEPEDTDSIEDLFSVEDFSVDSANKPDDTLSTPAADDAIQAAADSLRDIRDLTLAEFFGVWLKSPVTMGTALWDVLKPDSFGRTRFVSVDVPAELPTSQQIAARSFIEIIRNRRVSRRLLQVTLWLIGTGIALMGNLIMSADEVVRRSESIQLKQGLPFLFAGAVIWLLGEIIGNMPQILHWWREKDFIGKFNLGLRIFPIGLALIGLAVIWSSTDAPTEAVLGIVTPGVQLVLLGALIWFALDTAGYVFGMVIQRNPGLFPTWMHSSVKKRKVVDDGEGQLSPGSYPDLTPWYMKIHPIRLVYALFGSILSTLTWFGTSGNHISGVTFIIWLLSIAAWSLTFAPNINVLDWVTTGIDSFRRIQWKNYLPVFFVLVVIIGIGWYFRFHNLRDLPREMTDDHVEKILDSGLVRDGMRPIFFANNGGREPLQMYLIALASNLPGLGIDHFTIKVVAALESLITLPFMFWMAYELLEGESQRRRLLVALIATALLATSYWHVAITRQALRIALTPLVVCNLLIHLSRALRRNHLADFIKAGLVLGFGLYTYQAVRMLPVVIVVAVGIAVYFAAQHWQARLRYLAHLLVLVLISFVTFIPMFHYSVQYPELFWRRTTGRLLGDDVIEETLADGTIVMREASVQERIQAFRENVPQLMNNIRNVLLMVNWKGDVAAISGVPNRPAMDTISATLLIVGLAAWVAMMIRRRDVVMWMMPLFIFLMLLPSALSIAFPVENPSHTRTSGSMPVIYLIAALPLALLVEALLDMPRKRLGQLAGFGVGVIVILASYSANAHTYIDIYPEVYAESFDPYSEPGAYLRGFAISGGSYGNAFMVGYMHWWSHRAIGLAGGLETLWPNGIVAREDIPRILRDQAAREDAFRFDPQRDFLFFYSPEDEATGDYLRQIFPTGYASLERTYAQNNDYMVYRVPALGQTEFENWLSEHFVE